MCVCVCVCVCFVLFSFLVSNANMNELFYFMSNDRYNGSVLRFFAVATVHFSHITSVTKLFQGRFSCVIG